MDGLSLLSLRTISPSHVCFWNMKSLKNYNFLCSLDFSFLLQRAILNTPKLVWECQRPHLIGQIVSLGDAALFRKLNIDMIVTLLCYCGYRMANQSVETEKSSRSIICQAYTAKYSISRFFFILSWDIFWLNILLAWLRAWPRLKVFLTAQQFPWKLWSYKDGPPPPPDAFT